MKESHPHCTLGCAINCLHCGTEDEAHSVCGKCAEESSNVIELPRSNWTDAERDRDAKLAASGGDDGPELTGLELEPGRELTEDERKTLPPWADTFRPGRAIVAAGWVTRVVLIDPSKDMLLVHIEGMTRSAEKAVARAKAADAPKSRHKQKAQRKKK